MATVMRTAFVGSALSGCVAFHIANRKQYRSARCDGASKCPYAEEDTSSSCPVISDRNQSSAAKVFNVYAQEVNPANQMPYNRNQLPAEGQQVPLSTNRVKSSIPKGGTDSTWTYPSPQIFFNALSRKNKAGDVTEADMASVVAVHNSMNEQTWIKLMGWEEYLHAGKVVKLVRFLGRPNDLTPKARLFSFLGLRPKPFDRHDWIISRDGTEVRYVIDYYYDESGESGNTSLPGTTAGDGRVIIVDVRPAFDSFQSLFDRMRMLFLSSSDEGEAAHVNAQAALAESEALIQKVGISEEENAAFQKKQKVVETNKRMQADCGAFARHLRDCDSEEDCNMAQMGLKLCMAHHICEPKIVKRFMDIETDDEEESYESFRAIQLCLDDYHEEARSVLLSTD